MYTCIYICMYVVCTYDIYPTQYQLEHLIAVFSSYSLMNSPNSLPCLYEHIAYHINAD